MSVKDRLEAVAVAWDAKGRPEALLETRAWDLLQLICWNDSPGAKQEGVSNSLTAYIAASRGAKSTDWYDGMLSMKDRCSGCGDACRVENLQLCTDCMSTYCYGCGGAYPKGKNGNRVHSCGGEIVG